jgi:hypothetical protein
MGLLDAFAGPLIGYGVKQLFGGGAGAPKKSPYADEQAKIALQKQQMGLDAMSKYMPLLETAATNKVNTLKEGFGRNQAGRIRIGQAKTGADRTFGRANSRLGLDMSRRGVGLGSGLALGARTNLEGQRFNTVANAYDQEALHAIDADRNAENEIFQTYGNLFNLGNNLGNQGTAQVQQAGQQEQQRLASGQDAIQQAIQHYFQLEEMRKQGKKPGAGGTPQTQQGTLQYGSDGRLYQIGSDGNWYPVN